MIVKRECRYVNCEMDGIIQVIVQWMVNQVIVKRVGHSCECDIGESFW